MKNLLLGGMLVASMFASTANAGLKSGGPSSISGWGCAIAENDVKKTVTLGPNVGLESGVVKAGTKIKRVVEFAYDFTDAVECGKKHVFIHITSKNDKEHGVELLGKKTRDLKFSLAGGKKGTATITLVYKVLDPKAWQLTSKFHYQHSFEMVAFTH